MSFTDLEHEIIGCRKCERLVAFREKVALEKRKSFMDWDYWGKAVPGYGNPNARMMILGLAPAAHGGNRTGRVINRRIFYLNVSITLGWQISQIPIIETMVLGWMAISPLQ